jgi:hypothetical protein
MGIASVRLEILLISGVAANSLAAILNLKSMGTKCND